MILGTVIIRKCSACGELIVEDSIGSGNTFGARFWTDGRIIKAAAGAESLAEKRPTNETDRCR
ncbi:hypothetical protein JXA02_00250 [candidate division KSB1 bacterium]|nr:hypothetical protein [candidate division KSB1 bacterium]RQW11506.1 MAG: hypothetical protein EH222_00270 [candidate division KSB1 bacterium]